MTNYSTNLKQWGDVGTEYPSGYSYSGGEPPVDEWDDFFNYHVERDITHLVGLTNERLDSGSGTSYPTSATPGELIWRADSRRLAVYDDTGDSFREFAYKNEFDAHNHDSRYINSSGDTMSGSLTLADGGEAASRSWVNSSADVPEADNADSLGGIAASGYTRLKDGVQLPVYATEGDVPSSITTGEMVLIDGDGLYIEDGN